MLGNHICTVSLWDYKRLEVSVKHQKKENMALPNRRCIERDALRWSLLCLFKGCQPTLKSADALQSLQISAFKTLSLLQTFVRLISVCERFLWFCGMIHVSWQTGGWLFFPSSLEFDNRERLVHKVSNCFAVETSEVSQCHSVCICPLTLERRLTRECRESTKRGAENRGQRDRGNIVLLPL